ncbi:MAG TPA: phenylacetate--CoA ligase family protein [Chloroflexia bacterium]|nr:phenylacetate--CoA ligase family protein [Chloroflexia bacterium]
MHSIDQRPRAATPSPARTESSPATGYPRPRARRHPLRDDLALLGGDLGKRLATTSYPLFLHSAGAGAGLLAPLSAMAAARAADHTIRHVPAYRAFLARAGVSPGAHSHDEGSAAWLRGLPVTDKASYIQPFSIEDRCVDGRIPTAGTQIDESAGSSGVPYNWVRGRAEMRELHGSLSLFSRYLFGPNLVCINAFSMGAWATGVNAGEALRRSSIVKSTGPDLHKVLATLRALGPRYRYLITGYPPFLKRVVDTGLATGLDWRTYNVAALVGGEGMTEGLRTYLERYLRVVFSSYGATDLDVGMAGEMPISVWIRRQAADRPALRTALFGADPRLPMLFQYNPLDYYVETNADDELIFTVNRLSLLSPRIRYNIHDTGGVIPFARMLAVLRDFGLRPPARLHPPGQPVFHLPFLYLFGRSDNTVSYMGANIYPEDIEHALLATADDAVRLGAYCLELVALDSAATSGARAAEQRPCVHLEVLRGPAEDPALAERLRERILAHLLQCNLDFRAAVSEDSSAAELRVRLHAPGAGPFAGNLGRIKERHILRGSGA